MLRASLSAALLLVASVALSQEPFRAPFDGTDDATLRVGQAETVIPFSTMAGPFVPGVRGQARTLGGQNQAPSTPTPASLPPQGTILLWARPEDWFPWPTRTSCSFTRIVFTEVEREYVRLLLYKYWDTGELTVLVQNTLAGDKTSLIQVPIGSWQQGQWHHLAVTWDAAKTKLYGRPARR